MSRLTDTERGARIAEDLAFWSLQFDLFEIDSETAVWRSQLWHSIYVAARDQLNDCRLMRQARAT